MLNALLIGNPTSASGHRLARLSVTGRWIDPAALTLDDLNGIDLIALFGGDGTMQMTLSRILAELPVSALPPVALLPFGTTNMNATGINQTRSRSAAVTNLEHAIVNADFATQTRPLVRVRDGEDTHLGFFFGIGIIASAVERWEAERKPGPFVNHLRSLLAMFTGLRTASSATDIVLNGSRLSIHGLMATTLNRLIFGCTPYWGDAEPGAMRLTWIAGDAPQLLKHIPGLLRGRPHMASEPGYESLTTPGVSLALEGPYIIDGEIFHSSGGTLIIEQSEPIRWVVL